MMPDPKEPAEIAQKIIEEDPEAMEELLKDTEVEEDYPEDREEREESYGAEPEYSPEDDGGYF